MEITRLDDSDVAWVRERTELLFRGKFLVSGDVVHDPTELPGFVARQDGERIGLVTYHVTDDACEVVTIDALCQYMGVGTALLEAVEAAARTQGCQNLWLITTNDNLDALRFFQRRGFVIREVRVHSMPKIRALKPGIPETGAYGIPVRDEIELERPLDAGRGWRTV
jgi:DNA-3-methyladenine glycosylase I